MLCDAELFEELTHFTIENFFKYLLLLPMQPWVEIARLSLRDNYNQNTTPNGSRVSTHSSNLGTPERIIR